MEANIESSLKELRVPVISSVVVRRSPIMTLGGVVAIGWKLREAYHVSSSRRSKQSKAC
jgi:hypothetical protein